MTETTDPTPDSPASCPFEEWGGEKQSDALSRRRFVRTVVLGGTASCFFPADLIPHAREPALRGSGSYGVHRVSERLKTCHAIRDGEQLPSPSPGRDVDVVIVGGGPSGLVAAYRLRDRDILLLEKEPEVGGNARADSWEGIPYAAGSIVTYGESPAMDLYEELGLEPQHVSSPPVPPVFVGDRLIREKLWSEGLDRLYPPSVSRQIRSAREQLMTLDVESARTVLDRRRLSHLLRRYDSEVKDWFDHLLSWFGGTTDDYSAYAGTLLARSQMGQGLGVLLPEGTSRGGVYSFPGGLSRAALALRRAVEAAGAGRVLTASPVYRVEQDDHGVTVSYLRDGQAESVRARTAILALPKFIARHIVTGLPEDQTSAMERMRYSPLLVGAVGFRQALSTDVRFARTLYAPITTVRAEGPDSDRSLFRWDMPLHASRRAELLEGDAFERLAADIADYFERIFPGSREKIEQVRIWRRGHNWFVPVPGMVTGFQRLAARPAGRLLFANADSVGPVTNFGWALVAADRAVEQAMQIAGRDARRSRVALSPGEAAAEA